MNCKRLLSLVLALLLLGTTALAAPAASAEYEIQPTNDLESPRVWGTVVELGDNTIHLQNSNDQDPYNDIVLHVSEDTRILDAVTGAEKTFADLRKDETLYAYVSPVMTLSLPPQTTAELILCNIPADFGVPSYLQVESVTVSSDGNVDVLTNEALILHLDATTELLDNPDGAYTEPTDLKPGDKVLAWYDMVAESYPAQTWPSKIMTFPGDYSGYLSAGLGTLSINGEAVTLSETELPFAQDGKLMLPVRKTAETLGLDVQWNGETRQVTVSDGDNALYVIDIDDGTALVEGDMVVALTAPAILKNGVTFLAAEDLLSYHNLKLAAN